ncbi:hydroxyneurosporene methyltransferase [Mycobacterium spongiae]|uniref:Hydroxyneurosporene methyltransferase n=2 Tax=Mycobacterium spongiae TaxID=886343 RepID=A0A975K1Z1_9MYCO|nr:methyltransferase [Mycobacterium spongiae]QUR69588.1 hydroxyneurosporene methyltransferase [Mycobacterium spongiae]
MKVPPARLARVVERVRHHLHRFNQRLHPPPAVMMEFMFGGWTAHAITAAAQLNIADALAKGPLSIDELANTVGADASALHRLLRALMTKGIFRQRRDGRYDLSPLADTLRSDSRWSVAGVARYFGCRQHREHWTMLANAIRTGTTVVPGLRNMAFFDYLAKDPEYSSLFDDAMTQISELAAAPVLAAYDFTRYRTIVDVGGGQGQLLADILATAPDTQGILLDLPQVVAEAPKLLQQLGVENRVRVEGGSFFDSVPVGGDAYILKTVIHDWPDEEAVEILRNVRVAARADATVLVIGFVLPEHNREFVGKWVDLEMLLHFGSRERTEADFRKLLAQAGLRLARVIPTASPLSIVEASVAS